MRRLPLFARSQGLAVAAALVAFTAGCEPLAVDYEAAREDVPVFRRSALVEPGDPGTPAELRVVAWNIKYGAGRIPFWFDCWGDRVQMSRAEVDENLARLHALIRELDPDVLMTEEIEVNSRRSAYVDMVRSILENTNLNYAAYYETWNSQYVASEGVGRINLGNAIFSKYPIRRAERIRQEDRTDQGGLTRMFYIHRAVGRAELEVRPGERAVALVVHTEAYANDGTKQRQIAQIRELLDAETAPAVVGGDFNELPPVAVRLEEFIDERDEALCSEDFEQPPYTPQVMQPFYDEFVPAIALERYGATEAAQARYFTLSVLGPDESNEDGVRGDWNRTLDYLFATKPTSWVAGTTDVVQRKGQRVGGEDGLGPVIASDVLRLSDHAPVIGTWRITR
ncbi:MAG: endonuclease/exonuclease/phosphatase family protein [Deltaproteobacteria bacterium]|nr:endonuclease/exonuclease/phosphatase family protein [Deltaproteobacteria bacterium]